MAVKSPTVIENYVGTGQKLVVWGAQARPTFAEVIAVVSKEFPGKDFSEIQIHDFFTISEVTVLSGRIPTAVPYMHVVK